MTDRPRAIVLGASGHGRVVADLVLRAGTVELLGFVDNRTSAGTEVAGLPVLTDEAGLSELVRVRGVSVCYLAVGDNWIRCQLQERLHAAEPRLVFPPAVHPSAVVARTASIGDGSVVMAGAVVNPGARVGRFCIVNTRASLDHDSELADFASLAPGVSVGGNARIGAFAAIGIGAAVSHGRTIGEHAVIGAGAAVVTDMPSQCVAVGVPCRVIRARSAGDRYL